MLPNRILRNMTPVAESSSRALVPAREELLFIPTDDRRFRRWGLWVVLLVFGGLGAWAAWAPLSSAAVAPGVIVVDNYRKTVQHLEGGIVKALHVRDGDMVQKDQILAEMDDTQSRAQLEILRGQYFIAQTREARLLAQHDGLSRVIYPNDLLKQANDPRVQEAMQVQNQTFHARRQALLGEISLYQQQVHMLREKSRGLQAQKESRDQLAHSYSGELKDFESLLKDGYAEVQKVRELSRNLAETEGQRGELMSDVAATELQVSETELKILQLKKDFQREVAKELGDVQQDMFDLKEKLQSLQRTVERTVIRAPESGMVLGLAVHTIGGVIAPGGQLLDIVPQQEKLMIEAQVSPLDIDRIRVGQLAEVRFSSFKSRSLPRIEGRLVAISADRLMDEKEKTPFYLARVEIIPSGLKELASQKLDLVPGMPSEVLINTGDRTFFRYLTDPVTDVFSRSFTED